MFVHASSSVCDTIHTTQVPLPSPLAVQPGEVYVAAVDGLLHWAAAPHYFNSDGPNFNFNSDR